MSIVDKLLTVEEFSLLPDDGSKHELVQGKLVEMNIPRPRHGKIIFAIARVVGNFIEAQDLGHWFGDAGVVTERNPASVRGPDAAFTSFARLPRDADDDDYFTVPPDLVFEVMSPSERWPAVIDKVSEYLRSGVRIVCIVDPVTTSLQLHTLDKASVTLSRDDVFSVPEVLPGFSCPVTELFPQKSRRQ